ncbi:DNA-binding response regulator, OmpR family, contains REC and winged-helix (wHTH) domain [Methylobacterium sp. 174MFSha1.1]|uniref:response regulator transcription factor n=1 Tax=Methylobacterium sp. 174MFSha1.1 TaxID=1502749 RepID=UPI0008E48331|nr:response regulator transcription factor [Methylobacterium sp. 174MFSha1.1]SFV15653.1 DNA-binding response regulator, OmpR family, contains REC and winged-helix (wHTH) domain [Methylobacterium sp. 174MFSha1.1]
MYIVVDERESVAAQVVAGFSVEGVAARGLDVRDVRTWIDATPVQDLAAVQGFVIGDCADRTAFTAALRSLSGAPIIALNETRSLEQTLALFTAGIDDVVRKPVHVREIIARAGAIRRRTNRSEIKPASTPDKSGRLTVHTDGRDPEIDGQSLLLPRRERDILDYLARNRGRPVTKGQIFKAVYGDLDAAVDESVVEGHISKLRKKLRMRLGYDPIEAKRLAGYTFVG